MKQPDCVSFFFILCLFSTGCESFKENGGPWRQTEVYCVLFGSCCSSVFDNELEHCSKNYFTNIYSLIQVKESRQVVGKQKKTEFFCWEVCFNTVCKMQYYINMLEERVCALHCFWNVKSKVHEDSRKMDPGYQTLWILFAKMFSQYVLSKRISFSRSSQGRISFCCCYCPQETQPESLLESVGIPGCMCREPGMPCVCTRLIALGKEAIFIPKLAVVQVKSRETTIAIVSRLLSLSFPLQRFACTLLLTWASSTACDALLGCSAQGRGICCRNGWSFSLWHISQVPLCIKARFWQRSCWPEVEASSAAQEQSRSSGSLIPSGSSHQLPLTRFQALDPSAASALACGAASGFWGRVSRLDQSIVSGLHVIWKCQPYLFQAWIKGFAIAIC